jgi:hypothetical protein
MIEGEGGVAQTILVKLLFLYLFILALYSQTDMRKDANIVCGQF